MNKCYIFVIMRQYFFPCEALTGQIIGPILAHAHPMPAAQTGKEESPVSRLHCEMSGAQAEQPSDRLSGSFLIPGKEGEHASAFAPAELGEPLGAILRKADAGISLQERVGNLRLGEKHLCFVAGPQTFSALSVRPEEMAWKAAAMGSPS